MNSVYFKKKDWAERFHPSTFDIRHSSVLRFVFNVSYKDSGLRVNRFVGPFRRVDHHRWSLFIMPGIWGRRRRLGRSSLLPCSQVFLFAPMCIIIRTHKSTVYIWLKPWTFEPRTLNGWFFQPDVIFLVIIFSCSVMITLIVIYWFISIILVLHFKLRNFSPNL